MPRDVTIANVRGVTLEMTLGGGMGGDNWNLDRIKVKDRDEAGERDLLVKEGAPLFRFTGDQRAREFIFF